MASGKARRAGPTAAVVLIGIIAVAVALYLRPYAAMADGSLLESGQGVRVERGAAGLAFLPESEARASGLVFYAGAKVPPEAYAYLARACAQAGYIAVLPSFPLGLAVLSPAAAAGVVAAYPSVERWVVGGHSLGGAMACSYASKHLVAGLFLLAAYPGAAADLSDSALPAVCVSATNDGLATPEKMARARRLLPPGARLVELAGGTHAQFGEYGLQSGDGAAEISGPAQRAATVEEALAFLGRVEASR